MINQSQTEQTYWKLMKSVNDSNVLYFAVGVYDKNIHSSLGISVRTLFQLHDFPGLSVNVLKPRS